MNLKNQRLLIYLMFTLCEMGQKHQIKKSELKYVGKKVNTIF